MTPPERPAGWRPWLPRRLVFLMLMPALLVILGTTGYYLIENRWSETHEWSLFDALYMTVITLTTTGYGEVHPLSTPGRVFTIFLSLGGIFAIFYVGTEVIRSVVSGELGQLLGKRQMERALAQVHDHVIVCGYGRMGRRVCEEFSHDKVPFVIIDRSEAVLGDFQMPHGLHLVGDATSDEVLRRAGIDRARGLVTVMGDDADNVFATLSARLLNAQVFIVARVESAESEQKLVRAGANRVVSPYELGGSRLAQAVLRPTVVDFIELATGSEHIELQIEEMRVADRSPLVGSNLRDSRLRADLKVIIVAIKRKGGRMAFNPAPDTVLEADDTLVAIGHREHLLKVEALANPPRPKA